MLAFFIAYLESQAHIRVIHLKEFSQKLNPRLQNQKHLYYFI